MGLKNSPCYCGSAAKCISQNSKAQVRRIHQISTDVSPRRDCAKSGEADLRCRDTNLCTFQQQTIKVGARERAGDGARSAVKQIVQ